MQNEKNRLKTINKEKMHILKTIVLFVTCSLLFQNCTDVIEVTLGEGEPLLVVDAWLDNQTDTQTIKLRIASPYFDNAPSPIVNGASVTIVDNNNNIFSFLEDGNTGNYIWIDTIGNGFGNINDSYDLSVIVDGISYTSSTSMNRVPIIDSFTYEAYDPLFGEPEEDGWEAQFYARDFIGEGDTYWIKAFKNNVFLNKPEEINLAYDAAFSRGSGIDGFVFIEPIRGAINRTADSGDGAEDTNDFPPYVSGDTIRVELHSISNDAFLFLGQAQTQMTLGSSGIFAPPLENVPTNINTPEGALKAVGFFNIAAVESLEEVIP